MNKNQENEIIEFMDRAFPTPDMYLEKRKAGEVLIFAGTGGMAGAAMLSSLSALRTGSGLVRVFTKRDNFQAINAMVPEAICLDIDEFIENPKACLENKNAVSAGPGMGRSKETKRIIADIITNYGGPLVLDADALNTISGDDELKELIKDYSGKIIITPHEREAERLLGEAFDKNPDRDRNFGRDNYEKERGAYRKRACQRLFDEYNSVVLLKGKDTLVYDGSSFFVNPSGNPGMATAGSGDVLTGIIISILGRDVDSFDAARAGAYVHGLAGDLAAYDKGTYGMIARDIIENIPYVIKEAKWKRRT